jgi:hypothetical protein
MSDLPQGSGWWIASDGRWYAPELHPEYQLPPLPPIPEDRLGDITPPLNAVPSASPLRDPSQERRARGER